jgi:hypothetical protein
VIGGGSFNGTKLSRSVSLFPKAAIVKEDYTAAP